MYLKIKVVASAREEKVEILNDDSWRIWTKFPAENGLANNRVLEIVRASHPNKSVRIVSGHQSPSKIVSIG